MSKNIVIFDLETTGLDREKDYIIQFAGLKIDTDTNKIIDECNYYIQPDGNYTISIAAFFKHHINVEFLKDKPKFKEIAPKIKEFIGDCDILTYNGNSFDIPFLINEFKKIGDKIDFLSRKCYDAFLEEKRRNGNSLEETYKRYKGKSMEEAGLNAHDAFSDIKATYAVFYAQQKIKPYDPEEMIGEDGVIKNIDFCGIVQPCFNIGKYSKVALSYVYKYDKGYIDWCINKSNFTDSTKEYLSHYTPTEIPKDF